MSADRLTKYIWVIDTITTHGHITRQRLSELWEMSHLGDGRAATPHVFHDAQGDRAGVRYRYKGK